MEKNLAIGTLYEMNRNVIKQQPALSRKECESLIEQVVVPFWQSNMEKIGDTYFMMLCKEQSDYTVFNFTGDDKQANLLKINRATKDLIECFYNRANVYDIHFEKAHNAVEIWLGTAKEVFCYYLFKCNDFIIEV